MTIQELTALYPMGKLQKSSEPDAAFLSLPIDNQYFCLPLDALSTSEAQLLALLFSPKKEASVDPERHPWYGFLFDNLPYDREEGTFRALQFSIQQRDDFLKTEWQQALYDMFPQIVDLFFLTENSGVFVERYQKDNLMPEELEGIFTTLDADFETTTTVFIGTGFHTKDDFAQQFQEERTIFTEESSFAKSRKVFSLANVALHYFTKDSLTNSPLMQGFQRKLSLDNEMRDIILALWHNQGNISSTAKELFMHRNTLQYRLEKFHEQTGFSLKNMDDLILCYLLINQ